MHQELVTALGKLTNPPKNLTANAGQYSYKYADLASLIDHVKPTLAEHGLAVTQNVTVDDGKLEVYTYIHHVSGESITYGPIVGRAGADWQSLGSAITYSRRYALGAALGIAPEDDDDGKSALTPPPPAVVSKPKAVRVSHSDQTIPDEDPWMTPVDPQTGEEASIRPAVALVVEQMGGVIHDDEHPIRGEHMMNDPASDAQKATLSKCLVRGSKELGIPELEYLNAVLSDIGYPQVTSVDVVGKRACSAIFDHLFKGKK